MKVLHVNTHYRRVGGAETILFAVLEALEGQGVANAVVHQYPSTVTSAGRRVYEVPELGNPTSNGSSRAVDAFRRILVDEAPDVVHIHDIGNPTISTIARAHAPTVQSVLNHNLYCPGGAKYLPFLGRVCERPLGPACLASAFLTHCCTVRPIRLMSSYERCQRARDDSQGLSYLTLSRYQAQRLLDSGWPQASVKVVRPFTELPLNDTRPRDGHILFAGRLVKEKGLDRLIAAVAQLSCDLVVCGDGPEAARARDLARKLGVGDRVRFLGWLEPPELSRHYQEACVVAVPSIWPEPFGMVGIEAMSHARPVVAFNVGGIPEWLEDGRTGFLVTPDDAKEMASKIGFLLDHPEAAREMGQRGRQRVERQFTRETHVASLLGIYQELIGARAQPASGAS